MEVLLHTFLFADISGYSALTELEGDEAAAETAIRFATDVARIAPDYGAEVVRMIGDAVMVHCLDARGAIALGLRLQEGLAREDDAKPFPKVHVGINTGPAFERANDWWGATVNVAARVAAEADTGEVLITEATAQAAGAPSWLELRACGARRLKNISAPVAVYSPCAGKQVLQAA